MSVTLSVAQELADVTGFHLNICKVILEEAGNEKQVALDKLLSYKSLPNKQAPVMAEYSEVFSYLDVARNCAILLKSTSPDKTVFGYPDFMDSMDAINYDIAENDPPLHLAETIETLHRGFNKGIKIDYRKVIKIDPDRDLLTTYVLDHRVGAIVRLTLDRGDKALFEQKKIKQFAFDLAMHVVAFNPMNTVVTKLPEAIEKKLIAGMEADLAISGKEMSLWETIIDGKLKKVCEQNSLYSQIYIKREKDTVAQVLTELEKEFDCDLSITYFARLEA